MGNFEEELKVRQEQHEEEIIIKEILELQRGKLEELNKEELEEVKKSFNKSDDEIINECKSNEDIKELSVIINRISEIKDLLTEKEYLVESDKLFKKLNVIINRR